MTNFEKIKAMSVEEMADFFSSYGGCDFCSYKGRCLDNPIACIDSIKLFLESEVEE